MITLRIRSREVEWQLVVYNERPLARRAKVCLGRLMRLEAALSVFSAISVSDLDRCARNVQEAAKALERAMASYDRAQARLHDNFSL